MADDDTTDVTDTTEDTSQTTDTSADTGTQEATKDTTSDNWRDTFAGDDADIRKRLDRYQKPTDVAKALVEAQNKIREGLKPAKLSDKPSEEEVAEYRKAHGIPEEASGYYDALKGVVVGEEDRPLVDAFLESAHGINASPDFVQAALDWYNQTAEAQASAIVEADKQAAQARDDALRDEWGPEFRSNMNDLTNWLDTMGEDADGNPMSELLKNARLGDGTMLWNHPQMMQWLMGVRKEINPAAGVMPSGTNDASSIDDEIAKIEQIMTEDRPRYNKDTKMQDRYLKLLEARDKLAARAA